MTRTLHCAAGHLQRKGWTHCIYCSRADRLAARQPKGGAFDLAVWRRRHALTWPQVGEIVGTHPAWLRKLMKRGQLPPDVKTKALEWERGLK